MYGTRVSQAGVVLDAAGIAISTAGNTRVPSVAFDGMNYLVAWQDNRSGTTPDIYGARVSQAGLVLDPAGIAISTATNSQANPSVAFDGTNYLVAWEDARSGSTSDIYGARVSQSGVVLDPPGTGVAISTAAFNQGTPSVAFDGTNLLVAWVDNRTNASWDIYGARVNQAGVVLDPTGIALATSANNETVPSVSQGTPDRVAITYVRVAPEVPYGGAPRIFLRFFDEVAPPPPPPPLPPPIIRTISVAAPPPPP
jgi:hypothetical protein